MAQRNKDWKFKETKETIYGFISKEKEEMSRMRSFFPENKKKYIFFLCFCMCKKSLNTNTASDQVLYSLLHSSEIKKEQKKKTQLDIIFSWMHSYLLQNRTWKFQCEGNIRLCKIYRLDSTNHECKKGDKFTMRGAACPPEQRLGNNSENCLDGLHL